MNQKNTGLEKSKALMSVIIPAFKQEKTISKDLRRIRNVLGQLRYDFEMICVVDGRGVDKTFSEAKKVSRTDKKVKAVGYLTNLGKGHAVRYGIAKAKGDIIAFIDAGMEIDPNGISMLLEHMEWYKADIIIGSKRHPASQVNYPRGRRIISKMYQLFVKVFIGLNVTDTQVGLKIYRREVLEKIMPRLLVKQYAFDLEMLAVAHHLGYKRIYEAPIKIDYNFEDLIHASNWRAMRDALIDTLAIIYRLKILHYYDTRNKKNWITPDYLTLNSEK